ncbi:unnamed protein product, partial [Staurois parvus]
MGPPGNRGSWGPCVLAQTQKAYEKVTRGISWGPLLTPGPRAENKSTPMTQKRSTAIGGIHGGTDNSWGPRAIGDHRAPVSLPTLKKAYEKGTRGISWGPLLTPGSRALPKFPNGQSAP